MTEAILCTPLFSSVGIGLQALSDAELSAHIATLPFKSSQQSRAIITLVLRHPSVFPVVKDDPTYKSFGGQALPSML